MKTSLRLEAAKAAHKAQVDALNQISIESQRIEHVAQPAIQQASNVQSLRQSLRQRVASMFKIGSIDTNDGEIKTLSGKIANGEHAETVASAVLEVKAEALAELNAKAIALNQKWPAIQKELIEAQLEQAGTEITADLIPRVRAAAQIFSDALGELVGCGQAHCELARQAREQFGASISSLGVDYPTKVVSVPLAGFGIDDGNTYSNLRIDIEQSVSQAKTAALNRWTATKSI